MRLGYPGEGMLACCKAQTQAPKPDFNEPYTQEIQDAEKVCVVPVQAAVPYSLRNRDTESLQTLPETV